MGFFKKRGDPVVDTDQIGSSDSTSPHRHDESMKHDEIVHDKNVSTIETQKWKATSRKGGDVAQALFDSPDQLHEPIDPAEEKKLVRKIDFMIIPYLAVCYAFFYIDKTTLSYAAIFGIREDLNLVGTQYSWLSST